MSKSAGLSAAAAAADVKRKAQAEARAQARRRAVGWTVAGVAGVAMFAALVAFVWRQGAIEDVAVAGPLGAPVISSDGGLGVGSSGVAGEDLEPDRVRLDVYFDFICPWCAPFEVTQAETLDELRTEGLVDVYYHKLAYLDGASSGTEYSTRAASAAVVAKIPDHEYAAWVRSASDAANKAGVAYTPTLGINGDIQDPTDPASVQWTEEGALRQALVGG